MQRAFFLVALLFIFSSCKKEKSSVEFSSIVSGTDFNLYAIRKISGDSIIACGGKEEKGIVIISSDGGTSWSKLKDDFDQLIYDIYFFNNKLGFAAGGTPDVFKTTDGGITWKKLYLPFPVTGFPLAYRVPLRKIFFVNDSIGFICGGGRYEAGIIFKTFDKGQSWSLNLFEHELRGIYFMNQTTIIACGYGTIIKTTDSGNNWKAVDIPNEFYTSLIFSSGKLWAAGYNGGIYLSSDEGENWKVANKSNNAYSSRSHFNCMASTENGILIAAGTDGIISISRDNGASWEEGESFDRTTIKCIFLKDEHAGIAVGNEGKIFSFSF